MLIPACCMKRSYLDETTSVGVFVCNWSIERRHDLEEVFLARIAINFEEIKFQQISIYYVHFSLKIQNEPVRSGYFVFESVVGSPSLG